MNRVYKCWLRVCSKAGVPAVRFHDLRHTAATLMFSRDVHPKVVSEMLGHSNIATTMDIHSHMIPTLRRQAATVMDDLLGEKLGVRLGVNSASEG